MRSKNSMVTVLAAVDLVELAWAESALREHDIAFVTGNSAVQHLLGAGQIGGRNLVTGPPEIQVAEADLERARRVLRDATAEATSPTLPPELAPDTESTEESASRKLAIRYARYSAVWALFYLWGVGSLLGLYFGVKALRTSQSMHTSQKGLAVFGICVASLTVISRMFVVLAALGI